MWSPGAEALYGIPAAVALGAEILTLAHWNIDPRHAETYDLLGVGDLWTFHGEVITLQGRRHVLRTTVTVARDASGNEELIFTSHPAAEGTVPDVGQIHHVATAAGPSAIFAYCSEHMVIQYASPGVRETFGLLARDLIGHRSIEFVHPDDAPTWQRAWDCVVRHPDRTRSVEIRRINAKGEWRTIASDLTNLTADPDVGAVVINSRDVTRERQDAAALAASEQTLRSILQNSVEGVWICDASGATVFANARMAELLALQHSSMADHRMHDVLPQLGEFASAAGARAQYEFEFFPRTGSSRWLRINAVPRYGTTAEHAGTILMCSDISDQRAAEDAEYSARRLLETPQPVVAASHPVPTPAMLDRLSQKEQLIVVRLVQGDRVPIIARSLFLSQSTVRNHLASAFRKLGVSSQQEVIHLLRGASPSAK